MHINYKALQILSVLLACMFILCSCQNTGTSETEASKISEASEATEATEESTSEATGVSEESKASVPNVTGSFYISILDVGKADAIILNTENHTVVIDCGEKGDGKDILNHLSENNMDSIDYLFITHFDSDHVGGAAKVIKGINIGEIITPDYEGTNDEYTKFIEAVSENNMTLTSLTENMSFTLDDVLFEVYPPMKSSYKEEDNDYSLVISVTHGENKFLFAGDAEAERLKELSKQFDLAHTFLKVPHHGRYNAMSESFLKGVNPKYAVITCSEKNPAEDEVLNILSGLGCEVYQTVNGDVTAISDGKTIKITQ